MALLMCFQLSLPASAGAADASCEPLIKEGAAERLAQDMKLLSGKIADDDSCGSVLTAQAEKELLAHIAQVNDFYFSGRLSSDERDAELQAAVEKHASSRDPKAKGQAMALAGASTEASASSFLFSLLLKRLTKTPVSEKEKAIVAGLGMDLKNVDPVLDEAAPDPTKPTSRAWIRTGSRCPSAAGISPRLISRPRTSIPTPR